MRSEKGQENRRREEVESETLIQTERTNEGMKHKRAQKKVEGKRQRQEVERHNKTSEDKLSKIKQETSQLKTKTPTIVR